MGSHRKHSVFVLLLLFYFDWILCAVYVSDFQQAQSALSYLTQHPSKID